MSAVQTSQTSQLPFKPGERIAVPALPVLKIEGNVAVLKKMRPLVQGGCGARHQVRVEAPFYIRGGFKTEKTTKYRVPGWAFTVKYETTYGTFGEENVPARNVYLDEMPADTNALAEKLLRDALGDKVKRIIDVKVNEPIAPVAVYIRRFRHGTVVEIPENDYFKYVNGPYYFVYEFINETETKLVDDFSRIDYVLYLLDHSVESRAGCAQIKILRGDVIWSNVKHTCCATASFAVAAVVVRYGSKIAIARNKPPYRGCCEEWEIEEWLSEVPPRRVSQYTSSEPVATDLKPDEVA